MSEEDEEKKKKGTRQWSRSALYPFYPLDFCIDFARTIQKIGGTNAPISGDALSAELKLTKKTRRYSYGLSSARQFGLVSGKLGQIQLTQLASRILNPVDESRVMELKIKAFRSPPLYQKVIERFKGQPLPNKESLANLMMHEMNITSAVKDHAASAFIQSAEQCEIIGPNRILLSEKDVDTEEEGKDNDQEEGHHEGSGLPLGKKGLPAGMKGLPPEHLRIEVPLTGGRKAIIFIPTPFSTDDAERMKDVVGTLGLDE